MNKDIEAIKEELEQMENFIIDKIEKEGKFIDSWGVEWTIDNQCNEK